MLFHLMNTNTGESGFISWEDHTYLRKPWDLDNQFCWEAHSNAFDNRAILT